MSTKKEDVLKFVEENNIQFICLTFCDVYGNQKNVTIIPEALERAFESGISLDASQVSGFHLNEKIDLLIKPDPAHYGILPATLTHQGEGDIMYLICDVFYPDGTPFMYDSRQILKKAVLDAEEKGYRFNFGPAMEFYLFHREAPGVEMKDPVDEAGYMDGFPDDHCESIRMEICRGLKSMGIMPECAYHEAGPGQNKIKFRFSDPVQAADAAVSYKAVVRTVAADNGLHADFSPKPLDRENGSSLHINMSAVAKDGQDRTPHMIAGILNKISEITVFLNPNKKSYKRLGHDTAPKYISWSDGNRSTLIRIPSYGGYNRFELRSPDNGTNPYIAFALLIYACLYGIEEKPELQKSTDVDLFSTETKSLPKLKTLPSSLAEAQNKAVNSEFVRSCLPRKVIDMYTRD